MSKVTSYGAYLMNGLGKPKRNQWYHHMYLMAFCSLSLILIGSACNSTQSASNVDLKPRADSVLATLSQNPAAQRGYAVYRAHGCILCHGLNGEKGRSNPNAKTGEEIPSLTYIAEGYTKKEFQKRTLTGVKTIQRRMQKV